MTREEIKQNLCWYDERNPDYSGNREYKKKECSCDNCFYGRDELANELLKVLNTKEND